MPKVIFPTADAMHRRSLQKSGLRAFIADVRKNILDASNYGGFEAEIYEDEYTVTQEQRATVIDELTRRGYKVTTYQNHFTITW